MKPIGIIGGGLAGLSAACVLAARGEKFAPEHHPETAP